LREGLVSKKPFNKDYFKPLPSLRTDDLIVLSVCLCKPTKLMKPLPSHTFTHVILSLFVVSLLNSGCFAYKIETTYKTSDLISINSNKLSLQEKHESAVKPFIPSIVHQERYVIVHTEHFDCHFAQCVVDDRLKIITGNQHNISKNHRNHENSKKWFNHYNVFTEKPMNEVHIYMQEGVAYEDLFYFINDSNRMELSFDDIKKVEFHKCQNGVNWVVHISYFLLGMIANNFDADWSLFDNNFSLYNGPG
jgi:hypothetical protein